MDFYEKLTDPAAFTVFLLTLFLPVLIGVLTVRKMKDQSDFLIGGRGMNKFVVALSAVSSGRSSWLVLGVSGMAYMMGTGAVWAVAGYIIAEMIQFVTIGRRLRVEGETYRSLTLLDFFESRFNDRRHLIRLTGAAIITVFITAYVAAQLNAGARSLSTALNIPDLISLLISAALILVYMILGGYIAVAYNDVVRALIMIVGLVLFPAVGLIRIGGLAALLRTLQSLNPASIDPFSLGAGMIIGFLGIGLGSPGQPHIVVRYMSIKKADHLRYSAVIGTFWNVVLGWGAVFIGLIGRAVIPELSGLPEGDSEMVYLALASQFFSPVLYGLLLGGIFAAILSTADSQLLVVASTFSRDIYEKVLRKDRPVSDTAMLRISRRVVFLAGLLALILAWLAKDLIFWLVLFAWGGLGASFGSSLILSLYWKRTTKWGVISGMLTGAIVTILWKLYLKGSTGLYELIPAFFGALFINILVSLLTGDKKNPAQ